jgi:hypothetical protein
VAALPFTRYSWNLAPVLKDPMRSDILRTWSGTKKEVIMRAVWIGYFFIIRHVFPVSEVRSHGSEIRVTKLVVAVDRRWSHWSAGPLALFLLASCLVSQPLHVLCPRMTPRTMVLRILYAGCQSTQPQVWGLKTTSLGLCKIGCTINPSAMVGGIQLLLLTGVCGDF